MLSAHTVHQPAGIGIAFLVAALTAGQAAGTLLTVAMPTIAPAVTQGYGVPIYMIGYQVSIFYVGVIIGLVFGANLSTRWGACRTMQVCLALEAAGMLLASSGSLALLIPASLFMGFGYAPLTPASSHLLMRFTPARRRNVVFSIKQTGVPFGSACAAATAPALTLYAGWQFTLWTFAAVVCVVIAVLQWHRALWDDDRDPDVPLAASPFTALGLIWRDPMARMLAFAAGGLSCGQITMQNFSVAMFYEQLGMPLVQAGLILGAAQIGGIIGRVFWGWVGDQTRNCIMVMSMLTGVMLVASLACATLEFGWPLAAIALLYFVFGATASGWHGVYLSEIARVAPPGKVSPLTSGALLMGNVSAMITPLLFAGIYTTIHNYAWTFGMLAIPSAAALLFLRKAHSAARRQA